jgi:hypothetical protein
MRMKERCVHGQSHIVFPKKGTIKARQINMWEAALPIDLTAPALLAARQGLVGIYLILASKDLA